MAHLEEQYVIGYVVKARIRFFFVIIITEALLAFIGVASLAGALYWQAANAEVLAALISITSGTIGSLTTILMAAINTAGRVVIREGRVSIEPMSPIPPSDFNKVDQVITPPTPPKS